MAIAMLRRMRELRSEWQDLGAERPFQLRIGINTGYCTVGNFGGVDRMDYTIVGNMVNMAARLQTEAEVDSILVGHETYSLVKDVVATAEQSSIKVKGFAEPIHCYKVLDLYDDLVGEGQLIHEEQEGFRLMLDLEKHDKQKAISTLEAILARLRG
jgi:class 3 adenylate cyclase